MEPAKRGSGLRRTNSTGPRNNSSTFHYSTSKLYWDNSIFYDDIYYCVKRIKWA